MTVHRGWVPLLTLKSTKGHQKHVHMASSVLPDHHFRWQVWGEDAGEAAAGWAEGAKWVLVTQSCPALCNPMDCSPPGSSVHGDSPGKNSHALLQGIFLTQGLNLGLPHCRQILYHLSHQGRGSKEMLYSFLFPKGLGSRQSLCETHFHLQCDGMKWAHPHLSTMTAAWKQVSMRTTQSQQSKLNNVLEQGVEGIKTKAIPIGTRKDAQHCWLSEKCKSKLQWGTIWPPLKSLQITNAGKGVEKREPSSTVGGNVNWCSHYGEQYGGSSKN